MYVNLYPGKQLRAARRSMLLLGLFLCLGGAYALLREFLWIEPFRQGWALASAGILLFGLLPLAYGSNLLKFKDAFFFMTPQHISYRLTLFGSETVLEWPQIIELCVTEHVISFKLKGGTTIRMRLTAIQDPLIARHVSRSVHLAAHEKGILIHGLKPSPPQPALQV